MPEFSLPVFGLIDPEDADFDPEAVVQYRGRDVTVSLHQVSWSGDAEVTTALVRLLSQLEVLLDQACGQCALPNPVDWVTEYLDHHLECIEPDEMKSLFGCSEMNRSSLAKHLVPCRVWFHGPVVSPDFCIDITLGEEVTQYVIAIYHDSSGSIASIEMDS